MQGTFNFDALETKLNYLMSRCRWLVKPWMSTVISCRCIVQGVVVLVCLWLLAGVLQCSFVMVGGFGIPWIIWAFVCFVREGLVTRTVAFVTVSEIRPSVVTRVWRRPESNFCPLFSVMCWIVAACRFSNCWIHSPARSIYVFTLRFIREKLLDWTSLEIDMGLMLEMVCCHLGAYCLKYKSVQSRLAELLEALQKF